MPVNPRRHFTLLAIFFCSSKLVCARYWLIYQDGPFIHSFIIHFFYLLFGPEHPYQVSTIVFSDCLILLGSLANCFHVLPLFQSQLAKSGQNPPSYIYIYIYIMHLTQTQRERKKKKKINYRMFIRYVFIIFTNPSVRAGYDTRPIFKRSLTGLNSEYSFSRLVSSPRLKNQVCTTIYP